MVRPWVSCSTIGRARPGTTNLLAHSIGATRRTIIRHGGKIPSDLAAWFGLPPEPWGSDLGSNRNNDPSRSTGTDLARGNSTKSSPLCSRSKRGEPPWQRTRPGPTQATARR
ncbi:hypothetical protein MESS2_1560014 [Mesorhizobium metallidurans STM 2683]|uniref:Uncharacterized protein n=1 Tax=Mesorhizobium metallidurans STM 2683 TaxID=1297569 RepID=M5EML7_9HYPH|nr:hypothetical protein MESS2_1560014 [Mesorhizobium metallidurans STM 2683]